MKKRKLYREVKGKTGVSYYYDFRISNVRHRGVISEARNRTQAQLLAEKIWDDIYNKRLAPKQSDKKRKDILLETFINESYMLEAKLKKSYDKEELVCDAICEFFKSKTLKEITKDDIELFRFSLMERETRYKKKPAPATVNRQMAILKRIFNCAFGNELIKFNPCQKVKNLRFDNRRIRFLTGDEENRLMKALDSQIWLKQIVVFALNTGLRRGEIFNLKWFDVDFQNNRIQVKERKNAENLILPMNKAVRDLLKTLPRKSEYVFPSPRTNGKINCVKFSFTKALREAEIEDFRFHDLRHTAGTRLTSAGVSLNIVADILGHSDIRMTKRYAHATDTAKLEALEKLAIFNSNGQNLVKNPEIEKAATSELPLNS